MKKVIGGSLAIVIGLPCFSIFFTSFLSFLAGIIPLILIVAGGLTLYLKRDDIPPKGKSAGNGEKPSTIENTPAGPVNPELPDDGSRKTGSIEPEKIEPAAIQPLEPKISENKPAEPAPVKIENKTETPVETGDDRSRLMGNTGSLVFHRFDCKFSKSQNCTAVFFAREEAIQQGYKPCGICKP